MTGIAGAISISLGLSQLRFANRQAAGDILAEILWEAIPNDQKEKPVVLGIPRGGIIVAKQVADKYHAELGLVVAKKILAPASEEDAIGAIVAGEPEYLDSVVLDRLKITPSEIAESVALAREETSHRRTLYLGEIYQFLRTGGRTVILVDDGAATGSTLVAAARSIRKQNPALLVIGVPIATKSAITQLEKEADRVVTIVEAKENFKAVGQFYESFIPVTHEDVLKIVNSAKAQSRN